MDRLIFTAMSGMSDSMVRQRVIASNMANAQTIGFRAETLSSTPVTIKGDGLETRAMSNGTVQGSDMKAGTVTQTGRMLDVAVEGQAMIAVQAADGTEAYTRRGDLTVSASGLLQNGDGLPVLGNGGPITVPQNNVITLSPTGMVLATDPTVQGQAPQIVDQLKLVSPNGTKVAKGLDGLFRVVGGGTLPQDADAQIQSGALEQSNVDPGEVMVQMVQAQRLYEIRTKLISTAKDDDQSATALMQVSAAS